MKSRDMTQCYKSFRKGLGRFDDRFLDAFKTATESLMDIDDVLNEIAMIKRVHQDQARVWETTGLASLQPANGSGVITDGLSESLFLITSRLEEDAKKVREAVGPAPVSAAQHAFLH